MAQQVSADWPDLVERIVGTSGGGTHTAATWGWGGGGGGRWAGSGLIPLGVLASGTSASSAVHQPLIVPCWLFVVIRKVVCRSNLGREAATTKWHVKQRAAAAVTKAALLGG